LYAICCIIAYKHNEKELMMLASKTITVRVDDTVKEQAEVMLEDMGINMTTYIVSSLKALIREGKIPFDMVTTQHFTDQRILEKLAEAEVEAANPDTVWLTHEEVFSTIREKHGYEV
jgi:DNA-damage-inducible protein J